MRVLKMAVMPVVLLLRVIRGVLSALVSIGAAVDRFALRVIRVVLHDIWAVFRLGGRSLVGLARLVGFLALAPFRLAFATVRGLAASVAATARLIMAVSARLSVVALGVAAGFGLSYLAVRGAASVAQDGSSPATTHP